MPHCLHVPGAARSFQRADYQEAQKLAEQWSGLDLHFPALPQMPGASSGSMGTASVAWGPRYPVRERCASLGEVLGGGGVAS